MRNIIEFLENLFRSYRLSDQDCEVMFGKGYYFDMKKERFIRWKGGENKWEIEQL